MRCVMLVVAHRPSPMPEDPLYVPMHAGAAGSPETWYTDSGRQYLRDDTGDHISQKNATYCELTAQWWLWRNGQGDALGLCHYRRFFAGKRLGARAQRILTAEQAQRLMTRYDLILPKKRHYWIETNASQYIHAHHAQDLAAVRQALLEAGDQRYVSAYDAVMRRRSGHRFNMLLAKRSVFEAYSAWLFDVLGRVEQRLDISGYSAKDRRVFGYLAERLLDMWLEVNPQRVKELPVLHTQSQHWPRKIAAFLMRKYKGALGDRT